MEGGNPFLTMDGMNAAIRCIAEDDTSSAESHEALILAWEWEIAQSGGRESLPLPLLRYRDWLEQNPFPKEQQRFHIACLNGHPPPEAFCPTPDFLTGIYGLPKDWGEALCSLNLPHLALRCLNPFDDIAPPLVPRSVRVHLSPSWTHPFSAVTTKGVSHLFCETLGLQDPFSAGQVAHELGHIAQLHAWEIQGRNLRELSVWEREVAAIEAEHLFLSRDSMLCKEWARRAILDTLASPSPVAEGGVHPSHLPAARIVYAAAAICSLKRHGIPSGFEFAEKLPAPPQIR